jgi:thiosulfate/3-mercaptopyruvate sulfurtransferase
MSRLAAFVLLPLLTITAPAFAQPLVDAAWLGEHSCDDGVVVLDLRESERTLERGRVPCSVHAPYAGLEWRVERDGVGGMLPEPDALAALIGGVGVSNDDHVVVVGPGGSAGAMTLATRVYWTFKAAGHDAVSILDGGFSIYRAARGVIEKGEMTPPVLSEYTVSLRTELIAAAADVAAPGDAVLIDSRMSDQYVGVNQYRAVARAGTLPGAENIPITWLTKPDGRFQPAEMLANLAQNSALSADAPLITFCNSGQMASLDWFVAHELLGNDQARLYDGSMIDWAQDEARPVERRIGGD